MRATTRCPRVEAKKRARETGTCSETECHSLLVGSVRMLERTASSWRGGESGTGILSLLCFTSTHPRPPRIAGLPVAHQCRVRQLHLPWASHRAGCASTFSSATISDTALKHRSLFRWFEKKFPGVVRKPNSQLDTCDNLYVDANSIIHNVCHPTHRVSVHLERVTNRMSAELNEPMQSNPASPIHRAADDGRD